MAEAARAYVCVRVTNLRGIDLDTFRFDFDLTFAALIMNADGTIYHTYGGRDHTDPLSHLSEASFVSVLRDALATHEAYAAAPAPPPRRRARTVEEMDRWRGRKVDCFHCHQVYEGEIAAWRPRAKRLDDRMWFWPDPVQAGIRLDREEQRRIVAVLAGSAAERAGLRPGDLLERLGGRRVLTFGDVQRALDEAPARGVQLDVSWRRGEEALAAKLRLAEGWKEADPLTYSWRAAKWSLSPEPGFGGPRLAPEELERLGLARDAFAFRVQYLVTWGDKADSGRRAQQAGLRKGDVVLSVAGEEGFETVDHFHAWFRFTRRPGETVPIVVLRDGKRETLRLKLAGR